jgi:hypothetical protein
METILFCLMLALFIYPVCLQFFDWAQASEGDGFSFLSYVPSVSFHKAWWEYLVEPEARLAFLGAAIGMVILSLT